MGYDHYLQSTIVEIHDNSATGAEPFLHEYGRWERLSLIFLHQHITTMDQVFIHVLCEVHEKRRLFLVLFGGVVHAPSEHSIAQVVVLDVSKRREKHMVIVNF